MNSAAGTRPRYGAGTAVHDGSLPDSTPYPWPWDGRFAGSRTALLILDSTDGPPSRARPEWDAVSRLSTAVSGAGGPVIQVRTRCPDRPGPRAPARPDQPSTMVGHDFVVAAAGWDGFYGSGLDPLLRSTGRDLLLLCGAWLEVSVHSTMRTANDKGYECLLVDEACLSDSARTHAGALSSIEMSGGIFGAVGHLDSLLRLLSPPPAAHRPRPARSEEHTP